MHTLVIPLPGNVQTNLYLAIMKTSIIAWATCAARTQTVLRVVAYGDHIGGHFGGKSDGKLHLNAKVLCAKFGYNRLHGLGGDNEHTQTDRQD